MSTTPPTESGVLVQLEEDYIIARDALKQVLDTTNRSIARTQELLDESDSPRFAEVIAQLLKVKADTANKLLQLAKQRKEVKAAPKADVPSVMIGIGTGASVGALPGQTGVQRIVYSGDTRDLQRLISAQRDKPKIDAVL